MESDAEMIYYGENVWNSERFRWKTILFLGVGWVWIDVDLERKPRTSYKIMRYHLKNCLAFLHFFFICRGTRAKVNLPLRFILLV